jgi:hypothetical protein
MEWEEEIVLDKYEKCSLAGKNIIWKLFWINMRRAL